MSSRSRNPSRSMRESAGMRSSVFASYGDPPFRLLDPASPFPCRDFPASHHRRPGSRSTRVPCLISSTALDGHPVLPGNHVLQRSCTAMRRRLCDAGFRHNFGFSTHDGYRRVRAARRPAVLTLDVEFRESIVEKENLPGAPTPTMRLNGRDSALRSALTARSIESRMAAMTPQRTIQFGD